MTLHLPPACLRACLQDAYLPPELQKAQGGGGGGGGGGGAGPGGPSDLQF